MAVPGMLFGGNGEDEGCWECKGPVIRDHTTAYGKFFRRKAGFVSRDLLPDFLNYRRYAYPLQPDTIERMVLALIREHEALRPTDLRRLIFGKLTRKRTPEDLVIYRESDTVKEEIHKRAAVAAGPPATSSFSFSRTFVFGRSCRLRLFRLFHVISSRQSYCRCLQALRNIS